MKPIAIFRHSPQVGPGYFVEFLNQRGVAWCLIPVDEGASIPSSLHAFGGLCFLGGPMSVNDPLPWIEAELALIRQAVATGIPVIGHCLGGQLLSKALGGVVSRQAVKEIGWSAVQLASSDQAQAWLGDLSGKACTVYQWHGESFSLPEGASRIMSNALCPNQAFVLGPHLGMQCHVEMTESLIQSWIADWGHEFATRAGLPPSVQVPDEQIRTLSSNLGLMRKLTSALYDKWLLGIR